MSFSSVTLKLKTHSQLTKSPFTGTDCLFSVRTVEFQNNINDYMCLSHVKYNYQLIVYLFQGKLNYWCREKHWRHMQNVALEGQTKYGNDPLLKFFYGYSLVCEGIHILIITVFLLLLSVR